MDLRRPPVRPLSATAVGVLLVALDLRVRALDLLADPAGWLLIASGAWDLRLVRPALAAGIAAAASTVDVVMPYRYVRVDPETGEVVSRPTGEQLAYPDHLLWDRVSSGRAVAMAAAIVIGGVALWSTLGGLSRRADRAAATTPARRLRVLGLVVPAVWVLPYVAVVATDVVRNGSFDPVWNDGRELIALPGIVAMIGLAVVLALYRDATWAIRPGSVRPSRWSGRRRASAEPGRPR